MRKTTAVLMIFIFLLPMVNVTFLKVQQLHIRHEVKEKLIDQLPDSMLILFKFTPDQRGQNSAGIRWHDKNEFRYRGLMYDIVRSEAHGDSLYFYCFEDSRETLHMARLECTVRNELENHPGQKSGNLLLLRWLKLQGYPQPSVRNETSSAGIFFISQNLYLSDLWNSAPQTPPPEIV